MRKFKKLLNIFVESMRFSGGAVAGLWQRGAAADRAAKGSGGGTRGDEVRRAAAGCGSARWSLAPWEGVGGETKIHGGRGGGKTAGPSHNGV